MLYIWNKFVSVLKELKTDKCMKNGTIIFSFFLYNVQSPSTSHLLSHLSSIEI